MFTGLVEEVGVLDSITEVADGRQLRIRAKRVLEDVELGASISVDGACHTVTAYDQEHFEVRSIATTLQRTTLGRYREGRRINLERSLALGERMGGHLVQGHVDAVGEVVRITPAEGHVLIDFSVPKIVGDVTILHGSITVNGVSLTVNALPEPGVAQVSIIPHTWEVTALAELKVGDGVNLEGDLIGKYVRQLLGAAGKNPGDEEAAHVRRLWGYD